MRVTKEWIEQVEASGATWGLFVSITDSSFRNGVISDTALFKSKSGKRMTGMSAVRTDLWTIRMPVIDKNGNILLTHYEHRIPRSVEKVLVFAREFPPIIKYTCKASRYLRNMDTWKKLSALLSSLDLKGLIIMQLLISERSNTEHVLNIGFELENDAILFELLSVKS